MCSRRAIGRYSMQIHVCRSYIIKKDIFYHSQPQVPRRCHTHTPQTCVCVVAAQSPITTLNLKALAGMYSRCAIGRYSMQIHVCRSYNIKKDICYHSQSQVPVVHIHTDRKRVCVIAAQIPNR